MAKPLPYYPMYPYDWDEDEFVLPMTLDQVGLYLLALNSAWKYGSIPDDYLGLAVLIRRKPAAVKRAWRVVRARFVECAVPGRLVNPRQEIEREKAHEKSEKARESVGRRRDRNPYERSTNVTTNVSTNVPTKVVTRASESVSESVSVQENSFPIRPNSRSVPWQLDEPYALFRDAYLGIGGPATEADWEDAYPDWKLKNVGEKLAAIEHVKTCDGAYVLLPKNYIRKGEYNRPARPAPRSKTERAMEAI